ncbi:single-stranded-DNA-specific exonuclease RecJ, partial [Candidatus Saccharibacteria bacterium]|nr:single-stranded-DNA-specific exonuclease RecJ [Candidatus Saccharibacteria bacterium]
NEILAKRGLDKSFLTPKYEDLFDPFLMLGMKEAVTRIEVAHDKGEKIIIYGDYDADGVTASAVCCEALKAFGCEDVEIMLPNRFRDGYGLNPPIVPVILEKGAKLVVTVDCGSGSEEAIAQLKKAGVDTVVTDHHEIPKIPKSAVAVVNPHRRGEKYGQNMAGVGVAFTLARALNRQKNGGEYDGQEKWLLDLVLLGTICDSMLLRDENRIMSYYGMVVLGKTRRRGLQELAKVAKVDLSKLSTHAIGFQLGPRINAAGRMKSADVALGLVQAESRAEAIAAANELDGLNAERREAQDKAVKEIAVDEKDAVIVVRGEWHEGILGIIAGRLLEIYQKPTFVLTELEGGVLKGSGRSFGEFSLAEALQHLPEGILLSGGGHAGACGLSIKKKDFACFKKEINQYYASLELKNQERFLKQQSDIILNDFAELTPELYDEICKLEPFGPGNEEPIFEYSGVVTAKRILKDKHLSLELSDGERHLRLMDFYSSDANLAIETGKTVRAQFTLSKNEWGGRVKIEGAIISLEEI